MFSKLGQHHFCIATEYGRHSGWRLCSGCGHCLAAFANKHHGLFTRDDVRGCGCGDFADAVSGAHAHDAIRIGRVGEQFKKRYQTSSHDQGLRDGGVLDGFGIGSGAELGQVEAADGGKPMQAFGKGGDLKPRGQEARGLRTLSGSDDC